MREGTEKAPTIDPVARDGDEAIARSRRLGQETLAALEALRLAALAPVPGAPAPPRAVVAAAPDASGATPPDAASGAGADPFDVVLEREVDRLRRELRELLTHAPDRTASA